jgi:nucleotide-binding universal stress UspA family protein
VSTASAVDPAAVAILKYGIESEALLKEEAGAQVAAAEALHDITIEWCETRLKQSVWSNLIWYARHADLLVMTQEDPGTAPGIGPSITSDTVTATGRPVLLAPCEGTVRGCGEKVLLAWSGSRESARAAADALPMLMTAREVKVLSIMPDGDTDWNDPPGADIGLWLVRQGVHVTLHQRKPRDRSVAEQLLASATDWDSDLIVMGAYGRSRVHELVLKGVTRTVLRRMTTPVLMSH